MTIWTCPVCGHSERQRNDTIEVAHRCPLRGGRLMTLTREEDD